jgi:hypothetical protein
MGGPALGSSRKREIADGLAEGAYALETRCRREPITMMVV